MVAYLGDTEESLRLGIKEIAPGRIDLQQTQANTALSWDTCNRVGRSRPESYPGRASQRLWRLLVWTSGIRKLGINRFLAKIVGQGYEEISWNMMVLTLVVNHWGLPPVYEVFAGNRFDANIVDEMVKKIESQYGRANRIWVMDRGMVSEDNLQFLKSELLEAS